jgi:hypothetical protein
MRYVYGGVAFIGVVVLVFASLVAPPEDAGHD